ncbi:hypothetical protein N7445_010892 [Penicillium cf. griseofulvum]|nr:hypothetical protein N7445_010797 [Penicillium cf. griseofulvum]KAJ5424919.1 hypothetical protein N7445_010892 [Penicillium cf. griseofulvum]
MPKYALHTAYQWYCTLKSTNDPNLELPPLNAPDANGQIDLFLGERFCRYTNCPKDTPATSTNNLRKHYADKHADITLAARGGRPSLQDENDAVEFYVAIRDEYDANVDQAASIKPAIPRKADGTIHLTNMRKLAKERGGQIPCEPCKDAEDHPGCCREENAERCDNFELFLTGGGEE